MFGSVWNFVKRHRRKFIFTGVVIGGIVYLGRYARQRLQEFQEKEAAECLAHARRQHHFDSHQRTCNMTVLSMLPSLREALMTTLDAEYLTAQLKDKPSNKLEIWQELKIISFTRTVVAVYSCCMLIVMLRVQLNIIGGYMYVDSLSSNKPEDTSAVSQQANSSATASTSVQQRYLAMVQYLLDKGLSDLTQAVRETAQELLGSIPLKQNMSLDDIQQLITAVRQRIEGTCDRPGMPGGARLSGYMVPQEEGAGQDSSSSGEDAVLFRLRRETKDMLESRDFCSILTMCLDTGFTRLLDKLAEYFRPNSSQNGTLVINPSQLSIPLAKLIPVLTGLVHTVAGDPPNPFIQELLLKEQVQDFAANVYEAFSQPQHHSPA